jgi:hypothetical protein
MIKKHLFLLAAVASMTLSAAPIRTLSGLASVTFYEVTSGVTPYSFGPATSVMTDQLAGTLSSINSDFAGTPTELYDVFYSNSDGTVNTNGEYITIEGIYSGSGGGLNIGEVQLVFNNGNPSLFANTVASFVPGATNYIPANLNNIIDGNISTSTAMGVNAVDTRMRVTVGFPDVQSNGVPEPSSFILGALGIAGMLGLKARRRRV